MRIKLDAGAFKPTRGHADDAGLDLYSTEDITIPPHEYRRIDTGTHVEIPKGHVGLITSKSGLMLAGLTCRGTIDCGFNGAIQAIVFNHSDTPYRFFRGAKVTQLVVVPCLTPDLEFVDELSETERGGQGFGSTGK